MAPGRLSKPPLLRLALGVPPRPRLVVFCEIKSLGRVILPRCEALDIRPRRDDDPRSGVATGTPRPLTVALWGSSSPVRSSQSY
jgi:hypothetical protein